MTAANRFGLYSAFLACSAIFFRSNFTPMFTVLQPVCWEKFLTFDGNKPDNVLELWDNFRGCCRLVSCRWWGSWWGNWRIHRPGHFILFYTCQMSPIIWIANDIDLQANNCRLVWYPGNWLPMIWSAHPAPNSCLWTLPCSRTEESEACGVCPVESFGN